MPDFERERTSNVVSLFGPTPEEFVARVALMNDQLQAQPVVQYEVPLPPVDIEAKVQSLVARSRDSRLTPTQKLTATVLAHELRLSLIAGQ